MLSQLVAGDLHLPPDPLLRSYLDLIHTVFVDLRSSSRFGAQQAEYVYALANAMHNISSLIAHYDTGFLNDEKFRELNLRPFDDLWSGEQGGLNLRAELDDFLQRLSEARSA